MPAMTKWFDPSIKPVRPGWYETKGQYFVRFPVTAYWTGRIWIWADIKLEHPTHGYECMEQKRYWRGLKAPAK